MGDSGLALIEEFLAQMNSESRVAAANAYLAADAEISINGTPFTVPEYMDQIRQSDRQFEIIDIEVLETVVSGNAVVCRLEFSFRMDEKTYGIEPSDETLVEDLAAFHEIESGEIVGLHIVYDRRSTLVQLGLLSEDPTMEKLRDQYYAVLNRVLRHNLRNNLNAIQVSAELLVEDDDMNPDAVADQIEETTNELLDTVQKARKLEQMAIDSPVDTETIAVADAVDEIVDWYDVRNDVRCTSEYETQSLELTTDRQLFSNTLGELVENAVLHTDASSPEVTVCVQADDSERYAIELVVSDNGPGIPDSELKPLREDEETELLHGSGIGLWIIKWSVTRLHGRITFEQDDGARVRIRLPNL